MNVPTYLKMHGIRYSTSGKNTGNGWISVKCPFCGDHSDHLGYKLGTRKWNCWRCGKKEMYSVLSTLTGDTPHIIRKIIGDTPIKPAPKETIIQDDFELPTYTTTDFTRAQRNYLIQRGFDPRTLQNTWQIMGAGPMATLDGRNYANRIIIPIYWDNRMVSYTARAIHNKTDMRYLSCPKNRARLPIKHILYGKQSAWKYSNGRIICVEGPTDVWRMGMYSAATLGTAFTNSQLTLLSKFNKVFLMFDLDAGLSAYKIKTELRHTQTAVQNIPINSDPGDLPQEEADEIVNKYIKHAN